ncbi:hypothetical protein L21SP3_01303 [Sedimentisphaera cyanobacteriorum]|uniref:Uncharacterized protein n=2 Tax=Sedimentisphaera cyanobacteriorum TaxID=1940790 RepID=A0A1Q2HPZ4_9BACT|nr:hypothetical protein L21SP3_01303 [Sedimentisphaera cyanobacteriorum]
MEFFKKFLLFAFTLLVCAGVYYAVRFYKEPVVIEVDDDYTIVEVEQDSQGQDAGNGDGDAKPAEDKKAGSIGDTEIGQTEQSEFKLLDKDGNVASRFGFEKLLHKDGMRWTIREPRLTVYGDGYTCKLNSVSGTITVEMQTGKPKPVIAEFEEDVHVKFILEGRSDVDIDLSSLSYHIERNELTSDGTLELLSDFLELKGKGLNLRYESKENMISYLKIDYVNSIKVFEDIEGEEGGIASGGQASPEKTGDAEKGDYYSLSLNGDVNLKYKQQNVSCERLVINNILWKAGESEKENGDKSSGDVDAYAQPEKTDQPKGKPSLAASCKNGLEFAPSEKTNPAGSISVEIAGSPAKLSSPEANADSPRIFYDTAKQTAELTSKAGESEIKLSSKSGGYQLLSSSSMRLSRKDFTAFVEGPGRLVSGEQGSRSVLKFKSSLDIALTEKYKLKSAEIEGGLTAELLSDSPQSLSADRAFLKASPDGEGISELKLRENVSLVNNTGILKAGSVDVSFDEQSGRMMPAEALATQNPTLSASVSGGGQNSAVFSSEQMEYDFTSQAARASGDINLRLNLPAQGRTLPLDIECDNDVVYNAESEKIEFSGNVAGKSSTENNSISEVTKFTCEEMIVKLSREEQNPEGGISPSSIESIYLTGEEVTASNRKFTGDKLISAMKLTGKDINYSAVDKQIDVSGPGRIEVNNKNVQPDESNKDDSAFDLTARCFALVDNFSRLTINRNRQFITARRADEPLRIGYIPVDSQGQAGREKLLDAGRLRLEYSQQSEEGKLKISDVSASGGVSYFEPDRFTLIGEDLSYSSESGLLEITGSEENPCVLNNNVVEEIIYNVKTGDFKTSLEGISRTW